MAMSGGKAALSSRLASMGFMKRAAAAAAAPQQQQSPADSLGTSLKDLDRSKTHAAASISQVDASPQQQEQPQAQHIDGQPENQPQQKYVFSEKLSSMKFMQRGKQVKRGFEEAIGQQDAAKHEAEWVAPATAETAAASKGCIIIQERDPLPAGVIGRMSFNSFNLETEALQEQAEAKATGQPLPAAAAATAADESDEQEGVSIRDDEMAGWGRGKHVLSSLRMQAGGKKHKRQRVH